MLCSGCASLLLLRAAPPPARWVLILVPVSSSRLSPCSPLAHSWLWGRWVSTISPLAAPGRVVLPALLGGRGPRDRSTGGTGAGCMPAVAGAGWGCFPLCLLSPGDGQRCGSRPASFRQPIVVQLRGEGEGQLPKGFPNPGEGHHDSTAQPETAPGLVHPNTRLGGASRNPAVPAKTQDRKSVV